MVLINGFGILMGGLMMRAGLMMVIVWVDNGDSVNDHRCFDY